MDDPRWLTPEYWEEALVRLDAYHGEVRKWLDEAGERHHLFLTYRLKRVESLLSKDLEEARLQYDAALGREDD